MMQPDDPPFLTVGTEVSAKYKGAFCEAKVNKVVKIVKVKVNFKLGNGSAVLLDDAIKGVLKVGAHVKANHPDKGQQIEAIVTKIQDCSQYTVVFDDGDITTLRRSSLCLKSGRHFAESETLDQLPLTHPEHFGTPVVGGSRRGRRSRHHADSDEDTSDEENEGNVRKRHRSQRCEWESDMGKVVCVEIGDKKKLKDNWFPGLVVAPTAQDSVKIESKKDYLVRSFQDGRYYTVPKKEAIEFSRDVASKVAQSSLRTAVDKALLYIDQDDLPPHWDRDLLFGVDVSDIDSDRETDSDSSDDEPTEEKDHFVAQLYKFMEECGTPINKGPTIGTKDLDLYKLFQVVQKLGGFNRVMNQNQWKIVASKMCLQSLGTQSGSLVKAAYKRYLHNFDDFYRKLGCTMVSSPRGARARQKSGRSLIRDCDKRVSLRGGETDSAEETDKKDNDTEEDEKTQDYVEKAKKVLEEEGRRSMPRRLTPLRTMSPTLKEKPKEQLRSSRQQEIRLRNLSGKASSRESSKESVREEEPRRKAEETTKKKEVKEDGRKNRLELKRTTSAVKVESESEADEDEAKSKTRVLRNREEKEKIKEVETTKKTLERKVKQEVQPRSASCNSTSSGTSCASTGTSSSATNTSDVTKTTPKGKTPVQKCPNVIEDKRRGRKKRLDLKDEESLGKSLLPAHVPICVGDRLKVLYGPNNKESKVTYEAKVLEVEETSGQKMYYVHYNGWNTRYDEWVVRQRVAQNLTWCQNRMNKARSLSKEPVKEKQQEAEPEKKKPEKETTVAGTRANANSAKCKLPVKITRSDSTSSTRSSVRAEKPSPALTRSTSCNFDKSERRRSKRNSAVSTKEAEESGSDGSDCGPESSRQKGSMVSRSFSDTIQSKPTASSGENKESLNIKVEEGSVGKCGKDIDMKAIESEMKGLDRPAKKEELTLKETTGRVLTVIPGSLTFTEKKKHDPKKPFDSPVKRMEIPVKLVPAQEIMGQIKPMTLSDIKKESLEDDIYEFKEPEPFEFSDIRSRKDGKAKPQESPEGDVKVKRKTRPLKPDDSESDTPSTPQKRSSTFEESPSKRQDTSESTTKKDYTRKPLEGVKITPEKLIKDNQDKMNTLYNLQVKDQAGIATDKQYMYDLYSKDKTPQRMPVDVKDIKYELPDSKESHFISSSVIITPKKMATKKEPSPAKEEVIISPLKADANVEKVGLAISKPSGQSEKSDVGNRLAGTSSHVMAQVVMPPADSRILAMSSSKHAAELMKNPTLSNVLITPVKSDEKADGKLMSFSQRQQHIFPHLLNRPEHSEEKVDEINIQRISSANANAIHPFTIQQPTYEEHSPPVVSIPEDSSIPDVLPTIVSPDPDKLSDKRPDSTIGESIEAVILRARQDTAEEEKKDTSKPPDKRRRNPGRSKKTLSREFIPDTSEESDSENKSEKTDTRLKRRAGDGSKYSPSKKATRTSTDMDKKVARRCDEEERANDADEEDNEGNFSTQKLPSKEFLKRRNKMEEEGEQSPGPPAKLIKKKRLSAVSRRLDDGEETGLGDLMCEEDILPGSPMLQDNSAAETEGQTQPQTSDNQEMPFASVPTGSSFNKRTATPPTTYSSNLPLSLQQLPPSISIQSMSKSSTSSPPTPSSSVPVSTIQPHVTITSVTSPQAPVSSASVSPSSSEQPITNTPIQTPQTKMVTKAMAKQPFNAIESSPPSIPPGLPSSKDHSRMVTQHHSVPQKIDSHSSQKADSGQASHKSEQPRISPLIRPSPLLSNDHTPPTTPESMVSTLSDSPRREHEKFEDSEKGRTLYSSEMDGDSKAENYSEDSSTMDSHNLSARKSHSHSRDMALSARVPGARMSHSEGWDTEDGIPCQPKRKKKGTKMARPVPSDEKESPVPPLGTRRRRRRHSSSRTPVRQEEELEDTHGLNALSLAAFHSSRGKIRYNFVELEPELDAESRIAVLQSRMRELKRTYTQVKSELASVERKRKKLRKKEREKENAPAEVEGN